MKFTIAITTLATLLSSSAAIPFGAPWPAVPVPYPAYAAPVAPAPLPPIIGSYAPPPPPHARPIPLLPAPPRPIGVPGGPGGRFPGGPGGVFPSGPGGGFPGGSGGSGFPGFPENGNGSGGGGNGNGNGGNGNGGNDNGNGGGGNGNGNGGNGNGGNGNNNGNGGNSSGGGNNGPGSGSGSGSGVCGLTPSQVSALTPLLTKLGLADTGNEIKKLVDNIVFGVGDILQSDTITQLLKTVDKIVDSLGLGGLDAKPAVDEVVSILRNQLPCVLNTLIPLP
ncbi:hypothetical protein H4R24_003994 [Coemansia sp. RSA 988]|nr:hypothetical protein H4R24_003994 [Coemansia sp. RSA 988]